MDLPPTSTDREIEDANQKQVFVRDALPSEWLSYSEDLAEAAEVLWGDYGHAMSVDMQTQIDGNLRVEKVCGHSRSYILLAGLALENILKASLVCREPSHIASGALSPTLKTHGLGKLADLIPGLDLDDDEREVLKTCEDALPYWGRYPVPLNSSGLKPQEAASPELRDTFRKLHFRLCRDVYQSIKDGWDSGVGARLMSLRSNRYGDEIDQSSPLPWATEEKG